MALVALDKISLSYSGETILREVSLQVKRGDRIVLIGRNGAGKTSLLEILRGALEPDSGSVAREKAHGPSLYCFSHWQDVPEWMWQHCLLK